MLYQNSYGTFSHCFVSTVDSLLGWAPTVEVKGTKTKELLNYHAVIGDGMSRNFLLKHRHDNPFAKMFESLWVLAGRDDIDLLKTYLPRAADFSDDGKTWRAAYGPRLREWPVRDVNACVDQLWNIYDALKDDPFTRQAVATIWNPADDWVKTKDIPCNNWLHFIQRNGNLNLNVSVRSNDAWWGFSGINFYEWSLLLQVMAHSLGFKVGEISWNATSMHMYERHWAQAQKVLDCTPVLHQDALGQFSKLEIEPWFDFHACLYTSGHILDHLLYVRHNPHTWYDAIVTPLSSTYLFKTFALWLQAYMLIELAIDGKYSEEYMMDWFELYMSHFQVNDQYVTCVAYLNRQLPKTALSNSAELLKIINNAHPEVYDFIKDVTMSTT